MISVYGIKGRDFSFVFIFASFILNLQKAGSQSADDGFRGSPGFSRFNSHLIEGEDNKAKNLNREFTALQIQSFGDGQQSFHGTEFHRWQLSLAVLFQKTSAFAER